MPASLTDIRSLTVDGVSLDHEEPAADRVHRAVVRILDATTLCAWSTVAPDGTAHVNIGYFAYSDDLHLYLLSHPGSLHCRNVARNPTTAVAVFASTQKWTDPGRGIQLFGRCAQVAESQASEAERLYARRFRAYADWKAALREGDAGLDYRFYRFVPERLKVLDEADFGDAVFVIADIVRTSEPRSLGRDRC